ncbi:MAG: hypothetical protein QGH63_00275 [Rhodospirillales bacterium]|jgi:hypothetical protein|nr:hypothetical protein [Rhodospirillales bacterium]MDP7424121.1 hypothetical protein [Rhodospirillales bacterium]MDP7599918.1 hypothetical protein [Rhodospirillales bacterium]MDP7623788.1 hypothetical protein [Rhodospirillales bacterium]HJO85860.1 hypothetical protein [Rhodospirillales bacterium]|tara:strand:+ start:936 stop:1145 length:210 start_codon:yes stop_codon:yes gene_type:complete
MQSASELPQDLKPQRGVIPRMFGVALIFIGALDAMLSWRAGNAIEDFYIFLIAAGLFFLVIGQVRRRSE